MIRLACGLGWADYETARPAIYAEMLEEGRTKAKIEILLRKHFQPSVDDDSPVAIYISSEMAEDIKNLNFGYRGSCEFSTCYRGISPFAVASVSMEAASYRDRMKERRLRATVISVADSADMETPPGPSPAGFDSLMRQITLYLKFLRVLVGTHSSHFAEV